MCSHFVDNDFFITSFDTAKVQYFYELSK